MRDDFEREFDRCALILSARRRSRVREGMVLAESLERVWRRIETPIALQVMTNIYFDLQYYGEIDPVLSHHKRPDL